MSKTDIIEILKKHKKEIEDRYGIEKFALFGSVARDEATKSSDVDIVILKIQKKDLVKRMEAKAFLEKILGQKVDIGYFDSMKTFIKNRIKKDFIYV